MKIPLLFCAFWHLTCSAQIIIQSGLTHRLNLPPGAQEIVPLSLKNTGDQPMLCTLNLSDVVSVCDSGYRYLPAGSTEESCTSWLTLEQDEFVLGPGQEKVVKARFKSEGGYTRASARACVLVNSRPVEEQLSDGAMRVRVRYAINFLYRNPMIPGVVALHAQKLEMHQQGPFWALKFQNQGNVDRIVRSHAKLLDSRGQVVYTAQSESARGFIPNQCKSMRFPRPDVPAGTYQMVVLSETDEGERFGVTQEVVWDE